MDVTDELENLFSRDETSIEELRYCLNKVHSQLNLLSKELLSKGIIKKGLLYFSDPSSILSEPCRIFVAILATLAVSPNTNFLQEIANENGSILLFSYISVLTAQYAALTPASADPKLLGAMRGYTGSIASLSVVTLQRTPSGNNVTDLPPEEQNRNATAHCFRLLRAIAENYPECVALSVDRVQPLTVPTFSSVRSIGRTSSISIISDFVGIMMATTTTPAGIRLHAATDSVDCCLVLVGSLLGTSSASLVENVVVILRRFTDGSTLRRAIMMNSKSLVSLVEVLKSFVARVTSLPVVAHVLEFLSDITLDPATVRTITPALEHDVLQGVLPPPPNPMVLLRLYGAILQQLAPRYPGLDAPTQSFALRMVEISLHKFIDHTEHPGAVAFLQKFPWASLQSLTRALPPSSEIVGLARWLVSSLLASDTFNCTAASTFLHHLPPRKSIPRLKSAVRGVQMAFQMRLERKTIEIELREQLDRASAQLRKAQRQSQEEQSRMSAMQELEADALRAEHNNKLTARRVKYERACVAIEESYSEKVAALMEEGHQPSSPGATQKDRKAISQALVDKTAQLELIKKKKALIAQEDESLKALKDEYEEALSGLEAQMNAEFKAKYTLWDQARDRWVQQKDADLAALKEAVDQLETRFHQVQQQLSQSDLASSSSLASFNSFNESANFELTDKAMQWQSQIDLLRQTHSSRMLQRASSEDEALELAAHEQSTADLMVAQEQEVNMLLQSHEVAREQMALGQSVMLEDLEGEWMYQLEVLERAFQRTRRRKQALKRVNSSADMQSETRLQMLVEQEAEERLDMIKDFTMELERMSNYLNATILNTVAGEIVDCKLRESLNRQVLIRTEEMERADLLARQRDLFNARRGLLALPQHLETALQELQMAQIVSFEEIQRSCIISKESSQRVWIVWGSRNRKQASQLPSLRPTTAGKMPPKVNAQTGDGHTLPNMRIGGGAVPRDPPAPPKYIVGNPDNRYLGYRGDDALCISARSGPLAAAQTTNPNMSPLLRRARLAEEKKKRSDAVIRAAQKREAARKAGYR